MNLILLEPGDFVAPTRVVFGGRRLEHVRSVHRAAVGDELTVGEMNGRIGRGRVEHLGETLQMTVALVEDPPAPLPVTLVMAVPRPKVLNRVIAAATSAGVKRIHLVNAWRVEKSYWKSPRMSPENLREQSILGLEQGRDTVMPRIELHRLFRPFVEDELPRLSEGTARLVAHPRAVQECPRAVSEPVTLVIGPEGGFIEQEIASLQAVGFTPVTIGAHILRVETAIAWLLGRMF